MADALSVQEVKKLLDNPAVSDDVKRELVAAYVSRHWNDAGELKSYADRLGIPGGGLPPFFGEPVGDLKSVIHEAHRQIGKHNSDGGKQELGERNTGAANSNSILDLGAPGLRYFKYFVPLYQKCVCGSKISVEKARERYDEQRDLSFAALRTDSEVLTKSAATLEEEITTQRNSWNTIDQLWTGEGAEAASSYVSGYLGQAGTAQAQADRYAKVLSPVGDALEKAVHDKAEFVANLYADTIGGKTPEQIEEIIDYNQSDHNVVTSLPEAARIVHMFGGSAAPDGGVAILAIMTNPMFGGFKAAVDLLGKAKEYATNFVDNVFKPDVEGKWQGFIDTCTATDKSVQEIYQRIVTEANSINDHPFTAWTGTLPPVSSSDLPPAKDDKPGHGQAPTPSPAQQSSGAGGGNPQAGDTPPVQPQQAPPLTAPTTPKAPITPEAPVNPEATMSQPASAPTPAPMPAPAAASSGVPPAVSSPSVGAGSPVPQRSSPQGFTAPAPSAVFGSTSSIDPVAPASPSAAVPGAGKGVAWLRDAATLPQGWTINPSTGELTPPASGTTGLGTAGSGTAGSGAAGSGTATAVPAAPGVGSAPGLDAAPGAAGIVSGVGGALAAPGADPAVPSITITDGHSTLTVAAEQGGAHGVNITVADPTGHQAHYTVEMGPDGLPHLTVDPLDAPPAAGVPPVDAPIQPGVAADAVDAPGAAGTVGPRPVAGGLIPASVGADLPTGTDTSVSSAGADAGLQTDAGPQATVGQQADNSGQVRAASATGWTGDGDTSSEGGGPALAHTDPHDGGGVSAGIGAPALNLGGVNGDSAGTSAVTGPGDQWLVDGSEDAENSNWVSLGSVVAPEPAERSTMGSVATMIGNGEEPQR
ncbi:MAG: hypothetical protein M3Y19_03930 [Actinomycetota bacterium]|nr:hypothetical protein [Actinomycetota bacterium]